MTVVWYWARRSHLGVRLALCELELLLEQLDVLAAHAGVGLVLLQQLQVCRHLVLLLLLQVEPLLLPRRLLLQRSVLGEDLAAAVGERARRTRVTVASLESRERDGLHLSVGEAAAHSLLSAKTELASSRRGRRTRTQVCLVVAASCCMVKMDIKNVNPPRPTSLAFHVGSGGGGPLFCGLYCHCHRWCVPCLVRSCWFFNKATNAKKVGLVAKLAGLLAQLVPSTLLQRCCNRVVRQA